MIDFTITLSAKLGPYTEVPGAGETKNLVRYWIFSPVSPSMTEASTEIGRIMQVEEGWSWYAHIPYHVNNSLHAMKIGQEKPEQSAKDAAEGWIQNTLAASGGPTVAGGPLLS